MNSEKVFHFHDGDDELTVKIPEVVHPQYGMFTWPCALVLAQFVWHNRSLIQGKKVLEIGAGTALPGIVAAKCGALVSLSDSEDYPECLANCHKSIQANNVQTLDVLDFNGILATISYLLEKNQNAQFWMTYQERSSNWSIAHLLKTWGLQCVQVPLEVFGADKELVGGSKLSSKHTIQMLQITTVHQN
ncbi:histone-arginine methyltransferase METTL23 isoform X2 [Nematostella vectensis]|uniref:histone-arginine methyltransferase METTL23 isoform X2 n=1 Tax=Nematostella vectensis TaxID=45351 RepID=UPI002076FFFA|nr:histone-arginine methyltransferase METTL23 isoform X2 [Nematostella vectensis]